MRIRTLRWDESNRQHVARHEVEPEDVEEVFDGRPGLYVALGKSGSGRFLAVFFRYLGAGAARVVTARDMDDKERRIWRRHSHER